MLSNIKWKPYTSCLNLHKKAVHIFKIAIDKHYHQIKYRYKEVLSEQELAKADRFINSKDAERYIVSKYLLRCILSRFSLTEPNLIKFDQLANNKPVIGETEFNVTHSGNYIFIVTSPAPVGIDTEFINSNFDFAPLLPICFNLDERLFIGNGRDRFLNFYMSWTRKEAILKASGEGLTDHMEQLNCLGGVIRRNGTAYKLESFLVDKDYVMSLALQTGKFQLHFWDYSEDI